MTPGGRGELVIYQGEDGALRIEARMEGESIWLPMADMAKLFGVKVPAISKHVKNIYATRELSPRATVSKMETVRREGRRQVVRTVEHYSLDMIISVGYRVNSTKATRFRIWATQTLKEHLTRGYTLNRQRFEQNARELETAPQRVCQANQDQPVDRHARGACPRMPQTGNGYPGISADVWIPACAGMTFSEVPKAAAGEALTTDQGRGLVDVIARYTQFGMPAEPVPACRRRGAGIHRLLPNPRHSRAGGNPVSTA
jgi:hypothetical protein